MQRIRTLKLAAWTALAGPIILGTNCFLSGDDIRTVGFNAVQGFITGLVTTGLNNIFAGLFPS